MKVKLNFVATAILTGILSFGSVFAQEEDYEDLLEMSFEDLLNLEVTSISKKAERLQDVPSSIYVITREDIERSGSQNLMQLLRNHIPGYWAVANDYKNVDAFIRNTYEGSVLVLLDGTPMFDLLGSSFDYENFEIPFNYIERIEVIRGSGGTIYGANSATGVISIFTKNPDETEKLFASADYAYPGKAEINLFGTPVNDHKFAANIYGKYSSFSGFEQMPETVNPTSRVPKTYGTGDTTITNRFTEDDNQVNTLAIGAKIVSNLRHDLRVTAGINLSTYQNKKYYQQFPADKAMFMFTGDPQSPKLFAGDSVFYKDYNKSRVVGNLQLDYAFNETHNLFLRASTNTDKTDFSLGGGFKTNNSIVDFELQDNLELGFNTISFGGNYRLVNYNLTDADVINNQVLYTNPSNSETLYGFFVQDKISLLGEKLNIYLGLKGENFSLINSNIYFSPMAKFAYIPNKQFTVWGGFSQSYTTPGYNQTNIEYTFFRAPSPEVFYNFTSPLVGFQVYQDVYTQAINAGQDPETADQIASAYIGSPEGMYVIDSITTQAIAGEAGAFPGHFNVAAINGPNTVPTSFQNYEFGIRWQASEKLAFETGFYYSAMTDGIGNSPEVMNPSTPSLIRPGENIQAYYYGNYFKGSNMGIETMLKLRPITGFNCELSHTWFSYSLEFQENDDFDINDLTDSQRDLVDEEYPQIPAHVFRAKLYYDIEKSWRFSLSTLFATASYSKFGTVSSTYSYANQRFDPLYGDGGNQVLIGGQLNNRFVLDIRIDKYLMDQKLCVFVYGSDLTSATFTEGANQIETTYPRRVGMMAGLGVSYKL